MIHRMPPSSETLKSFLKGLHRDPWAIAPWRLCGWDIADIMAQDKEAVGEVPSVFAPRFVPRLPASQHASAAEALDPVSLPKIVQSSLGQLSWVNRGRRRPQTAEASDACILLAHVGSHGVRGLIHHLAGAQAELHGLGCLVVHGAIAQGGEDEVAGAVHAAEEFAGGRCLQVAVDGRVSTAPVLHRLLTTEAAHSV